MNTKDTLPALAAAPALLPLIAPYAAPVLIGGAIAAGILWLLRDDEKPAAETAAKTGDAPPAPKRTGWTFFDVERDIWGNDPKPALTDTARVAAAERIRQNDAEIAQVKRELYRLTAPRTVPAPAIRTVTHQATPAPAQSPRSVAAPVVTPPRDLATTAAPRCVTPPAQPTPRDAAPMIAPRPATSQAAPAVAVAASVTAPETPGRFQLKARKYDRAHLEAVLKAGPMKRAAVVKALKAAPFNYGNTIAYATLQRFADALEQTPDGLLAWKTA